MPNLPGKFQAWPEDAAQLEVDEIMSMYNAGFSGVIDDPQSKEEFRDFITASGGYAHGSDAAHAFGIADLGKGKLSLPWMAAWSLWPECWPGPAQRTGDCVSWGTKNSCLVTLGVECIQAKPDEVTGKMEGPPEVSATAVTQGVLATENIYGARGHRGAGADCARLGKYVVSIGGLMVRANYPDIGLDLTKYNEKIGMGWGGSGTPENVNAVARQHAIRTATELNGWEQVRDFLAAGYGVNTCSSLGFESKRNEDGFSEQRGSWSHSQAIIGFDDRPETVEKYKEPLALWQNSWASFNSGPRKIRGTNIDIPNGSYWARASLFRRCYLIAFSSVDGWPARQLPDYGICWP